MLVFLTVRKLKSGSFDDFRKAWEPRGELPPGFIRAYHARNVNDEDEVVSFGLAEVSLDDARSWREGAEEDEQQRQEAMDEFIESVGADGVFEVIDVYEP